MARILLAEDDDSLRPWLARALRRDGHDVVAVRDGVEAVEHLGPDRFDVLLADIVMPGMDGIELARRAERVDRDIRVMFITGFAAVAMQSTTGEARPARVLSKPFHLRDVVDEVRRMLDESGARAGRDPGVGPGPGDRSA